MWNRSHDWGPGRSKCIGIFSALGRAVVVRSVSGLALGEFPASGKDVPRLSRRLKPWGVGRGPHLWEVAGPSSRRGHPYLLVALRAHSQAADVLLSSVWSALSGTTFNVLRVPRNFGRGSFKYCWLGALLGRWNQLGLTT